jgi:hypothetical protein
MPTAACGRSYEFPWFKGFLLSIQNGSGAHAACRFSPRLKQPEREVNHSN